MHKAEFTYSEWLQHKGASGEREGFQSQSREGSTPSALSTFSKRGCLTVCVPNFNNTGREMWKFGAYVDYGDNEPPFYAWIGLDQIEPNRGHNLCVGDSGTLTYTEDFTEVRLRLD